MQRREKKLKQTPKRAQLKIKLRVVYFWRNKLWIVEIRFFM